MTSTAGPPTIGVQIVVFANPFDQLCRLADGLETAIRHTAAAGHAEGFEIAFGDSSPTPLLSEADVDELRRRIDPLGVHRVSSTFFDANLGSGGGSQRLLEASATDLIWVLNPDTVPSPTVLSEMLAMMAADTAAVDARQVPIEHPAGFDPDTGEAAWVCGACVLLRRTAIESVGGFDPRFFPMYCDDVDLSWRLRLDGWKVRHSARATVFHDKRLDADGRPGASEFEHESGVLSRLFLARRYERPDVVEQTLEWVDVRGTASHRRAAATYRARLVDGDVPEPMPGAGLVANLDSDYYGPNRFRY